MKDYSSCENRYSIQP